ncbi:MAG TPA: energy transducer TonB [Acidobacteriaceae bacterium]|jgi:protein TonB
MDRKTHFDELLEDVMQERMAGTFPMGMEQRLLARLAQERPATLQRFMFADNVRTPGDRRSLWMALGAHAAVILLIAVVVAAKVQIAAPVRPTMAAVDLTVPVPPPPMPKSATMGGGGGQHDLTAATQGHLPKPAKDQIVPPMAPPTIPPRLAVEPTVVMQPDLKIAENNMPNLGLPNSTLHGVSLGNGSGTGIGAGNGPGVGPGSGGNVGGGVMHWGGAIKAPVVIHQADAEFSEEARKAKFSGNVEVYLWVDEQGNPSHIRVARGVGMGLDEKAIEAVRQYKFKPATLNGKPVKVDLTIEVDFRIY